VVVGKDTIHFGIQMFLVSFAHRLMEGVFFSIRIAVGLFFSFRGNTGASEGRGGRRGPCRHRDLARA